MVEEPLTNADRYITTPDLTFLTCDLPSESNFVLIYLEAGALPASNFQNLIK